MKLVGKKICALLIIVALLSSLNVFAAGIKNADEPEFYTINDGEKIAIPEAYTYEYNINTIKNIKSDDVHLGQPSDLFIDRNDNLYIADTNNNRVVCMTANGEFIKSYSSFGGKNFNQPEGVFVTENGKVYIADTDNSRIVEFAADGSEIREFGLPKSELLKDVNVYNPQKIVVSTMGMIYVLMGENIMSITEDNEFVEYFGQSDIDFDFVEWLLRLVASEEQQNSISKRNAAGYTNFCLDSNNLIYATCLDKVEGQIKILNSVGNNIYRKLGTASGFWGALNDTINGFFSGNIIGKSFQYGEITNGKDVKFNDICVNSEGIITVVENESRKVYQYDASGNLLCVFGCEGTKQGEFSIPSAIVTDSKGNIYILDTSYGNISVFSPTDFITKVQKATIAYTNGDYKTSSELWNDVLRIDQTYPLAHLGIGNTLMKEDKYEEAMESYKLSNDRKEYSVAFTKYRHRIIHDNFGVIVLVGAAIFLIVVFLFVFLWRKTGRILYDFEYNHIQRLGLAGGIWMALGMCLRPTRTLEAIKNGRGRISQSSPLLILFAVFAVRIMFIYTVSYPLQDIERVDVNLILEFIKLMLPVITWIGAVYLISEQFNGEATLKETFITSAFSMTPYIVINLLAMVLSHILCWQEKGFFALLVNGVLIICVLMLLKSCRIMNDYSVGRTILVALLSLVVMVLVWFICLFGYSLIMCLKEFFADILQEIQLMS